MITARTDEGRPNCAMPRPRLLSPLPGFDPINLPLPRAHAHG